MPHRHESSIPNYMAEGLSYRSSPYDDFRNLTPRCVDKFIAEQLQVDDRFRDLVYTALDSLCRHLQHNMRPPTVRRIIKSGSMGKGTALKRKSDLDCIVIMNGVEDALMLDQKYPEILAQIATLLEDDPLRGNGWGITIKKHNKWLVQIEMHHFQWNESVEVDIVPTFDAEVYNGYSRDRLYNSMKNYGFFPRALCSGALAELQRDFVKKKPAKLKNLIRLVKHWGKTYLPSETGQPRLPCGYMLELLTIDVWERNGSPDMFTTAQFFSYVMEALYNHSQLDVKWDTYYSLSLVECGRPRIMDPANPHQNLYKLVKDWEWVKTVIKETLQMPLFQNYTVSLVETPAGYCTIA